MAASPQAALLAVRVIASSEQGPGTARAWNVYQDTRQWPSRSIQSMQSRRSSQTKAKALAPLSVITRKRRLSLWELRSS